MTRRCHARFPQNYTHNWKQGKQVYAANCVAQYIENRRQDHLSAIGFREWKKLAIKSEEHPDYEAFSGAKTEAMATRSSNRLNSRSTGCGSSAASEGYCVCNSNGTPTGVHGCSSYMGLKSSTIGIL